MILGAVGAGGPDWGGGSGGRRQWQGARWDKELAPGVPDGRAGLGMVWAGGPDGSCWGWWGRRVVGHEGQMAGVVGQEADGREPDGAGAVGQGWPDGSCWG